MSVVDQVSSSHKQALPSRSSACARGIGMRGAVAVPVAGIILTAVLLTLAHAGLYADGSYYLLMAVKSHWIGPAGRWSIDVSRQLLVLLAVRLGMTSMAWLTLVQGIGFFCLPAAAWVWSIWLSRRQQRLLAATIVVSVCCWSLLAFFGADEIGLGLALIVIESVVLTRATPWTVAERIAVLICAAVLLCSYEGLALCAIVMCLPIVRRMRTPVCRQIVGCMASCSLAARAW